jgi:hypothetical protein
MRRQNPGRSVRDIAAQARTTRAYPAGRSISSACPPPTIPGPHAQRHTLPGQLSPQSTPRPTPERGVRVRVVGPGSGRSLLRPTVQVPSGLRGRRLLPGSHQPEAPVRDRDDPAAVRIALSTGTGNRASRLDLI